MTDFETKYRDLVAGLEALADEWANQDPAYWHMLHEPDVKRAIEAAQYALDEDFHALLASSPAEGEDDPDPEGCDCTELCEMGPTCPGGSLARLPGSGCWRTTSGTNRTQIPVAVDGLSQGAGGTCPSECAETNHPGREHGQWIAAPSPAEGTGEAGCTCSGCRATPVGMAQLLGAAPAPVSSGEAGRCGSDGGTGVGAGHRCTCSRKAGHPLDSKRPHGCSCGAPWGCVDCVNADEGGCAECGAAPAPVSSGEAGGCVILCGSTCGHDHNSVNGPSGCCEHGPYLYFCQQCHDAARPAPVATLSTEDGAS